MARMTHATGSDKIQTLRRLLAARHLDVRDFEIEEDARSGIGHLLGLSGGIISLRRRSTGEIRVYAAGPGAAWYAAICADLDSGYFKGATSASGFPRAPGGPLFWA
jgi:hypothetical protein